MTTITVGLARPDTHPDATPALARPAGWAGTLRSELTKLRSVRSTYWTLLVLFAAGIACSIANCVGIADRWAGPPQQQQAGFDATQASILGMILLGQLAIVVLGALAITSEYSTGMIRTSLTVMPRRGVPYGAKAAVFAAVMLAASLVATFASFFIGQALLASTHHSAMLATPNALRSILLTAVFVTVCGLFAYGFGAIIRHTAGAMTLAARRRGTQRHHLNHGHALPGPVLGLGRVRRVRRLRGDPGDRRCLAVPQARRLKLLR
jgi:ABC-2 type transport system permease protein